MVLCGLVFAALGIASCIIPGILVAWLTVLIGLLNLAGGIAAIVKIVIPALKAPESAEPAPGIQVRITMATLAMNVLAILFGTSMLIPGIFPGLVLGVVLAANGCVLLFLVYLLVQVQRMAKAAAG